MEVHCQKWIKQYFSKVLFDMAIFLILEKWISLIFNEYLCVIFEVYNFSIDLILKRCNYCSKLFVNIWKKNIFINARMVIFIYVKINKQIKYQSVTYGFDKLLETQSVNFCDSLEY